jgi:hypothetical protein
MRTALAITAVAFSTACSFGPQAAPVCAVDADCDGAQICFPDGCGDPGKNLVVEVTANTRNGQHEQDFTVADGTLRPTFDLGLDAPMTLQGEMSRDPSTGQTGVQLYLDPFTVRASGESEIIPGITRNFEQTFTSPERGAFSLPIGAGKYSVTVTAADTTIPPVVTSSVRIANGGRAFVQSSFTALDGTLDITGRLIRYIEPGVPPNEVPLTQAAMELLAYDPIAKRAISQKAFPSSGISGSRGDFVLAVDPAAKLLKSFQIIARPREATAPVPTKTFTLNAPYPVGNTLLEMGDFGTSFKVKGVVIDTTGNPVGGASVYLEGPVAGGGTFKSQTATTDLLTGEFAVEALPSLYEGAYTVTVLPLSRSQAGVLTTTAKAVAKAGTDPVLEPARFTCPDKVGVVGDLFRADGMTAAAMVLLTATPVKAIDGRPLPTQASEVVTDDSGHFNFSLDPAVYRFDFQPGEDLPRMSRYITIHATAASTDASAGGQPTLDLGSFTLSKGRKVTGNIFWTSDSHVTPANAVNARVRFFRLTTIDGKPGATLLGEALTDSYGVYGVVLPGSGSAD